MAGSFLKRLSLFKMAQVGEGVCTAHIAEDVHFLDLKYCVVNEMESM